MKKTFLIIIFSLLTCMVASAQKVEKDSLIELRISTLEKNNVELNHNLDVFEKRNKDRNSILFAGLIFETIGCIILNTKYSNFDNVEASKPFFIIGASFSITSVVLTLDNTKWIRKNKRLTYKEFKELKSVYE